MINPKFYDYSNKELIVEPQSDQRVESNTVEMSESKGEQTTLDPLIIMVDGLHNMHDVLVFKSHPFPCALLITGPLSMDKHLKIVREATWEIRAKWYDLGTELEIKDGTLQVSFVHMYVQYKNS